MTEKPRAMMVTGTDGGLEPGDTITIDGAQITVVTQEEAEGVAIVVCLDTPPLIFADNLVGACAGSCGRQIQWRPYSPKTPLHLCLHCAQTWVWRQ